MSPLNRNRQKQLLKVLTLMMLALAVLYFITAYPDSRPGAQSNVQNLERVRIRA